ncbi:MAG: glycosyltransferase family 39 protein [Anaerolineae bacterium]
MPKRHHLILLGLFMLLGVGLRFYGQAEMRWLLHSDEAYYGLDSLSLIDQPRVQVYFPANTGREGLWMNLLAPMIATQGATPFALRITSALVGILTLGAVYALARQTLKTGAVWAVGALAVLYWHVHLSHIGFRVITLPLIGALAFASVLRAHRHNQQWALAGVLIGLMLYTYVASQVYVVYAVLWLMVWAVFDPQRRRGALVALACVALTVAPLLISMALSTAPTTESIGRAAASDWGQVWDNLLNWRDAWLLRGDANPNHNLPNRPILDAGLALLALIGLGAGWWVVRRRWLVLWWGGLVWVSLMPTILSINTPHYLRGAGLIVPLVLVISAGGAFVARWRWGWLIPLLIVGASGWLTYQDFGRWLQDEAPTFGITYDYRVNEAMRQVDQYASPAQPIIMPTDDGFRAPALFLARGMGYDLTFYRWSLGDCYLSPRVTYTALDLPIVSNSFSARVLPYAERLQTLVEHPEQHYNVFSVTPNAILRDTWDDAPTFGGRLQGRIIAGQNLAIVETEQGRVQTSIISDVASTVRAGDTIQLYWAMRLSQPLAHTDYRVLVHLQGDPTPYEGGTLYQTADVPLCELAYTPQALDEVSVVQTLALPIPLDLPAGDYHVALGFYRADDGTRLSVTPAENAHDYYRAWQVTVTE